MSSRTDVFRQRVRDHMRAAPVVVPKGTPTGDAVAQLAAHSASSLIIVDPDGSICGIVTEQDVGRRIAYKLAPEMPIDDAMTRSVATVSDNDLLYQAIAVMRRRALRHMPVLDHAGRPVGVVELHDALAVASEQMVDQIDRLAPPDLSGSFDAFRAAHVSVASQLLHDHVPASEILGLVSHLNAELHRRIIDECLASLTSPPVRFAVIVMGSAGRGESAFGADQDNGLILDDYPDSEHDRVDAYFRDFAEQLTGRLEQAGFPKCRGYVMATNPLWRKSLGQWRDQIDFWLRRRSPGLIRLGDIFFDFDWVHGEAALAAALRAHVTQRLQDAYPFVQTMHAGQIDHRPAIGWFDRLLTERAGEHRGMLNLKYGALLPLIESIRLLALRHGVGETGTPERLDALAAKDVLDRDELDALSAAFETVAGAIVRQQIDDIGVGRPPSYWFRPRILTRRQRRQFTQALKAIEQLRGRIRMTFTGDVF